MCGGGYETEMGFAAMKGRSLGGEGRDLAIARQTWRFTLLLGLE
jgi:hypothetical protein